METKKGWVILALLLLLSTLLSPAAMAQAPVEKDSRLAPSAAGPALPPGGGGVTQIYGPANGSATAQDSRGSAVISQNVDLLPTHTLQLSVEGQGSVTLNPPGGVYTDGTTVVLTAVPEPDWMLAGWSGDLGGSANPAYLLMDGDKVVTATFQTGVTGEGAWVVVPNMVLSNLYMVNTVDDSVHGPFLQGQLGSDDGGRFDVEVTPDGQKAVISNFGDMAVYIVDVSNPLQPSVVASVTIPFFAEDMAISSDGRYALVADGGYTTMLASIDIASATLVDTANLGTANAQGVAVAPDGTVIIPDYSGHSIHTTLLEDTGEFTYANPFTYTNTYTYVYPSGSSSVNPVNVALGPDGQTIIVCDAVTSTIGVYRIVSPGVLTFTGIITGLHGLYGQYEDFLPGVQSVAFNEAGDKAYASINRMTDITGTNTGDRIGVLDITGPGQVSLEAGGVVTVPHYTDAQLFGVDTLVVAGRKLYVGYPTASGQDVLRPLAVVDLDDYSVTTTMAYTRGVAIPVGVAALPLRLEMSMAVSDPAPVPGQIVTYTLVLSNAGPRINEITLQDILPPEVEFVGPVTLTPAGTGTVGAPPNLVTDLYIPAHQQATVTFPVRVRTVASGTVIYNWAEASSPELVQPAGTFQSMVVAPHLAMDKAVSAPTPALYRPITYTIVLSNTGGVEDPAVLLTDTLPAQTDFDAWIVQPAGAMVVDDRITWSGPLLGGEELLLSFSVLQHGTYGESFTNTAEFSGTGQSGSAAAAYTVALNEAPVLNPIGPQTVDELATLAFTATAVDANQTLLTFTLAWVGTITPRGAFTWTPTEAQGPGRYTAIVVVSDGELADAETILITVTEVNVAPVLAPIGEQAVTAGTTLVFTATATDGDIPTDTLTFSLDVGAPSGAVIDPTSGAFTWTPTEAQGPGVYTVTVRVTDDGGLSDTEVVRITVNAEGYRVFLPVVLKGYQAGAGQP